MGKAKAHLNAVSDVRVSFDDADREACGDAVDEDIAIVAASRYKLIILTQEAGLLDVCLYIAMPCTVYKHLLPSQLLGPRARCTPAPGVYGGLAQYTCTFSVGTRRVALTEE